MMLRPFKSNDMFWTSMHGNGMLDERSIHAWINVTKGAKYGLNGMRAILIKITRPIKGHPNYIN